MAPIINDPAWFVVRSLTDAVIGANGLTFGHSHQPARIDMQADAAVRKAGGHTAAIAFEGDQARRRHPFAVLDKPIEGRGQPHQHRLLRFPCISNRAGQVPVVCLGPRGQTEILQPPVQLVQIFEDRHDLPQAVARILQVLPDSSLLPASGRVAELGLKDIVAGHGLEAGSDGPVLARRRRPGKRANRRQAASHGAEADRPVPGRPGCATA